MNKDEELFQKRLIDLSNRASQRGVIQYSDFMNLNELNIFHSTIQKFSFVDWKTFGGYEYAERQMVSFIPDAFSFRAEADIMSDFPIACIKIMPLNQKFADALSHRDYLGAILNLGIERCKFGDILLDHQNAFLFCTLAMSEFLCRELTRIKHTSVQCMVESYKEAAISPRLEIIKGTVASVRLDALLALAFKESRSSLTSLIEEGKVFVNGRLTTSNGYVVKEGDIISTRGYGRFRFKQILSQTKKGRNFIELEKYV